MVGPLFKQLMIENRAVFSKMEILIHHSADYDADQNIISIERHWIQTAKGIQNKFKIFADNLVHHFDDLTIAIFILVNLK